MLFKLKLLTILYLLIYNILVDFKKRGENMDSTSGKPTISGLSGEYDAALLYPFSHN